MTKFSPFRSAHKFAEDNETLLADMTDIGQRVTLAKGGNGVSAMRALKGRSIKRRAMPILAKKDAMHGCGCALN